MRDIGNDMIQYGERANLAYQTYVSAYLDCVDDNQNKMYIRMMDTKPLHQLPEDQWTEDNIVRVYLDAAVEIMKQTISSGCYKDIESLYQNYPMLRERSSELEEAIPDYERGEE